MKSTIPNEIRFYRAVGEYGFLSNLYRSPIIFEGREFRCAEEAYQFGKPKDPTVAEWIVMAPKPHLTAAAAHALLSFDIIEGWGDKKTVRMAKVLNQKFTNQILADKLVATYPAMLIEDSKTDPYWGIGKKGVGENMLGILLMATRNEICRKRGIID